MHAAEVTLRDAVFSQACCVSFYTRIMLIKVERCMQWHYGRLIRHNQQRMLQEHASDPSPDMHLRLSLLSLKGSNAFHWKVDS